MKKPEKKQRRRKFSVIAETLYEAYRRAHKNNVPFLPWGELTDDERQRWEDVADEAYEFYRERFIE